ncbi:MAG: alpha/beta fold hydrolase, partial [Chloroflexota bacterium]
VWGDQDRLVSVAHAHAYTAGLPNARCRLLPAVGHYPYVEAPEAFAQAVAGFLAEPQAPSP